MRHFVALLALVATCSGLNAQPGELKRRLLERGAPAALAEAVEGIAAAALAQGLPAEPIAAKAFEGLAKGHPPDRIVPVVRAVADRLKDGRDAVSSAGLDPAPGAVVAAAAEALGRGMSPSQVAEVIKAAPTPEAAATGLAVAASLAAQGLSTAEAASAVANAYRQGRHPREVLELPSLASALIGQGVKPPEVAKQILKAGSLPITPGAGPPAARPPTVPPGRGAVTDIPASSKRPTTKPRRP